MLFVASDTHGTIDHDKIVTNNNLRALSNRDYLLICGDTGIVWDDSPLNKELAEWYASQDFTTLYIDGNHENFDLLNEYPIETWKGGKVHKIRENVIHLMRGQVFKGIVNEESIFTFGGGFTFGKLTGQSKVPIWPEEMPSEKEYKEGIRNLSMNGMKVDHIFTHTCPTGCLSDLHDTFYIGERKLNDYLDWIRQNIEFKDWHFGHFHIDLDMGPIRAINRRIIKVI